MNTRGQDRCGAASGGPDGGANRLHDVNPLAAFKAARELGIGTSLRRAIHLVRIKSGWLERRDASGAFGPDELLPHIVAGQSFQSMLERRRSGQIAFFFSPESLPEIRSRLQSLLSPEAQQTLRTNLDELRQGRLTYFSRLRVNAGDRFEWRRNPVNGQTWAHDRHWSRMSLFQPELGDVKLIWEASRFAQCFTLVRAYALSGEDAAIELALQRIESWIDDNPPVAGPLWACGQEASFRVMAWSFALGAAYATAALKEDRFAKIAASIYRHGLRIERHIGFARAINNNHSLSEAAGLLTIGLLFPEFDRAGRWRDMGRRILKADARRLFYHDGSFIQHSMNYHRVALHDCLWAARLAQLHGLDFPSGFSTIIGRAAEFLYQMHDRMSGRVPNYGANDGALVLPLTACDYLDFRPVIQSAVYHATRERVLPAGNWDEEVLWLMGPAALDAPPRTTPLKSTPFESGGYYTIRGSRSWAMVRCHSYVDRPGEADMLHFDLWFGGENILRDAGSYSYFCPAPWDKYFKSTKAHNTVEVDGLDQMTRGPRFLWHDWTRARLIGRGADVAADAEWWEGEHEGYVRRLGVVHRRRVERRGESHWTIVDQLLGKGSHTVRLFWRLGDWPFEWHDDSGVLISHTPMGPVRLTVAAEGGLRISGKMTRGRSDDQGVQGWESLYYAEKLPIPVLTAEVCGPCPIRLTTHIELPS